MKRYFLIISFLILFFALAVQVEAQCSICTKTAQQLGEEPAEGLNAGILYLALTPLAVIGFIGYRWWRNERGL